MWTVAVSLLQNLMPYMNYVLAKYFLFFFLAGAEILGLGHSCLNATREEEKTLMPLQPAGLPQRQAERPTDNQKTYERRRRRSQEGTGCCST
jgi:hypothetical protein